MPVLRNAPKPPVRVIRRGSRILKPVPATAGGGTVTLDAVGPSSSGAGNTSSASLSWSHTCGASASYLLVGVNQNNASDLAMSVTYNSVAMTSLSTEDEWQPAGGSGFLQLWGMANPPTGSAFTVAATVTGGTPTNLSGGSVSLIGAGSLGTVFAGQNFSTAASAAVTGTVTGSLVVAFCGTANGGTFTVTAPGTQRISFNPGSVPMLGAQTSPGGGTVTPAWTTTNTPWAVLAVEVLAGAAATPGPPRTPATTLQAVALASTW